MKRMESGIVRWSVAAALAVVCAGGGAQAAEWDVTSPNGQVRMIVLEADGGALSWRLEHGAADARATVVGESPLGLKLQGGGDFSTGLKLDKAGAPAAIDESYEMPLGKRRLCRHQANQRTLAFRNAGGEGLELDIRAANDGAAFRYRLTGAGVRTLEMETGGFAIPADARLWLHPNDKATTYSPAYETYYENEIAPGTPSPLGQGWAFPVLFRTADSRHWGLITEANVGTNFCGSRLTDAAGQSVYRVRLPTADEGNGAGCVQPSSTLPWEMPWRVVIVGDSPGVAVESTLVQDLSAPSRIADTRWIKPGRVAWSWWSDNDSPSDGKKQMKFVDLAVEMGWEYVLVDANWTIMDNGTIHDVMRYAKEKGVGILLWYNSGGPHNVVTEKPRDCFFFPTVRRFELDLLRKWGVKGVKVDFFQSDKQDVMNQYLGILSDAAERQIMINFHGCTLPRGWARTWPNLLSMEAIRGEECYIFDDKYPKRAPGQSTISPFTRNAVGSMDYTPVGFSDNKNPHLTTYGHELALSVLFESGWVHFTDRAEAYLTLPPAPKAFLKAVPTTWDDTRFVAGYPGQFTVIARRKGDTWYVAGINGTDRARQEVIRPGAWLGTGTFERTVIGDGDGPRAWAAAETVPFAAGGEWTVNLRPYGGFVATLKPAR